MNRKKKCSVCGKVRKCRLQPTSKGNVQPRCLDCCKKDASQWYRDNKEYKNLYWESYKLGFRKGRNHPKNDLDGWLEKIKADYSKLNKEQRLKRLFV